MNNMTHTIAAAALLIATALPSAAQKQYIMLPGDSTYSWAADLHHRLLCDFTKSRSDVEAYIKKYIPDVTDAQMDAWEKSGALETRVIDGRKLYFHNAAPNLFRIDRACAAIKAQHDGASDDNSAVRSKNVRQIMREAPKSPHRFGDAKRIKVRYTITVQPDAVPDGEVVRCWMPLPRTDIARQQNVRLLSASEMDYDISPTDYAHSTFYADKRAEKGKPTVFWEEFEYTSYGEWHDLRPEDIRPYDTSSELYRRYTSERDAHIVFTPRLRQLADSLTRGIDNPLLKARSIFRWIDSNFPWASAREYSTIENIPEYVLANRHGDCGQVSLLFITLCRICGIPAHFQSGFMLHPGEENLHDWSEVYFEGVGWVPVDMSFGTPGYAANDKERLFYMGGIDSWRMVVNDDFGGELYPHKRFPRSETVDFQRGEVEWRGGNLYFDKWSWHLEVLKD